MDIIFFLKNRTKFIQYFHEHAVSPFTSIIEAIENEEEPYIPQYSEYSEPPFLEEWLEANTGIETIGHTSLSMLSSSLHLFLKEWVHRFEIHHGMEFKVNFKKKGWFNGYREIFEKIEIPMNECLADLEIIEQITLARNRIQHPEEITRLDITHSKNDLKKYPRPFFVQEHEMVFTDPNEKDFTSWWVQPSVTSTKSKVFEAIRQVELLCSWLENEYWKAINNKQP